MSAALNEAAERDWLVGSGLFEAAWYLRKNPDVAAAGLDPLAHFCLNGWREGRRPNRHFDPHAYLDASPELVAQGINPLLHYARIGESEGRRPIWHFDPVWYRQAYEIGEGVSALAHFLAHRGDRRFAPTPGLWSVLHLPRYRGDIDPFEHFLDDMEHAGRAPLPDLEVLAPSQLVDANFYLINGSDVREAGLDPAEHFCRYGWREGRKPNLYFDTRWYQETNPRLLRQQINPLVHYLCEGEPAGRRPVPYFDPQWYRATYAIPADRCALAHFLLHRRSQAFSPTPLFDVGWYVARHADDLAGERDPFAHFLQAGTFGDIDPSPGFDAAAYRRRHLGRPSRHFPRLMHPDRDNPLVHHLRRTYR